MAEPRLITAVRGMVEVSLFFETRVTAVRGMEEVSLFFSTRVTAVRGMVEYSPATPAVSNFAYFQLAVKVLATLGSINWLLASSIR